MAKKVGCPKGQIKVWKEDMTREICVPISFHPTIKEQNRQKAETISKKLTKNGIENKIKKHTEYHILTDWRSTSEIKQVLNRKYLP